MTSFSVFAALMLLGALFTLVRPLLRKPETDRVKTSQVNLDIYTQRLTELDADLNDGQISQQEYGIAQQDLEKQLIIDIPDNNTVTTPSTQRSTASLITVALAVPALSIGLYLYLGNPDALDFKHPAVQAEASNAKSTNSGKTAPRVAEMIIKLEQRLEREPDNVEGWKLLTRSYTHNRQFLQAEKAYQQLTRLVDNDPGIWADYADTVAVNQKGKLQGRPYEFIKRALSLHPKHPKALWLAGTYHFQKKEYHTAIRFWKILQAQIPHESSDYKMIHGSITDARQRMGIRPDSNISTPEKQQPANPPAVIKGRVRLDEGLKGKVSDTDSVFVYARATRGPRIPLAVVRKQVQDLPFEFILDDSMAMMPEMKLSGFDQVIVGARISKSGNAISQSGDLTSDALEVNTRHQKVLQLNINKTVP